MFNLMALAFISVIEWLRIPTFIPKSALSRLVNSCDDFDVRRAIQFNDSIKIIFSLRHRTLLLNIIFLLVLAGVSDAIWMEENVIFT